jgi:hypothetical protein
MLLLPLVVIAACRAVEFEPLVLEDRPVLLSQLADGWRLFKGYEVNADGPVVGAPAEAFLKLIALRQGRARVIRTPSDLEGLVTIKTTDDALAFVRLFTAYDSFYLFDGDGFMEVVPTDNGDLGFGELPRPVFLRLGLYLPRVRRVTDGFIVDRCLACDMGGAKGAIYAVEERVSFKGRYAAGRKLLATDVEIFLPGFW